MSFGKQSAPGHIQTCDYSTTSARHADEAYQFEAETKQLLEERNVESANNYDLYQDFYKSAGPSRFQMVGDGFEGEDLDEDLLGENSEGMDEDLLGAESDFMDLG